MQKLRNKLIAAIPAAERAVLEARLENVNATIRERIRSNREATQPVTLKNLNATARQLKQRLREIGS